MKFTIPTNWQDDLISAVRKDNVYEVYGKLNRDFVGGIRAASEIPAVGRRKFRRHVDQIHQNGLEFNYLLNSVCLGNTEWNRHGQRSLRDLLARLVDAGVDSVTVSIPYLLEIIKSCYPRLKVCVSSAAGIDTLKKAKWCQDLGADRITLPPLVNRDVQLLKAMIKGVHCRLQLIANLDCLLHCPFSRYHQGILSHASRSGFGHPWPAIDYCYVRCHYEKLLNPVNFIRSAWIRPEDLAYYESLGIESIKFVDRRMQTGAIALIVDAYTRRDYRGNLLNLFPHTATRLRESNRWASFYSRLRYLRHPLAMNLMKLYQGKKLFIDTRKIFYVDNQKLDGFLDFFAQGNCAAQSCADCRYCADFTRKAVEINETMREKAVSDYKAFLGDLVSGKMFSF